MDILQELLSSLSKKSKKNKGMFKTMRKPS